MFRMTIAKDGLFAGYLKLIKISEEFTYYEIVEDIHDATASDSESFLESLAKDFIGRINDPSYTSKIYDLRPIY